MSEWSRIAKETIARVGAGLAEDLSFKERKAAIDQAYPFGPRSYWPSKAWCKARRKYLARFGGKPLPLTPLEQRIADMPRDPVSGRPVIL